MKMAEKIEIEISCCLCTETHKINIALPDGWGTRYGGISEENGFCPRHKMISKWADSQCPGCVGGWGDCDLWRSFAYTHSRNIDETDLKVIQSGKCPRRTNGTISFSPNEGMHDHDLSEIAGTKEGEAFAQAIREYCDKYPKEESI